MFADELISFVWPLKGLTGLSWFADMADQFNGLLIVDFGLVVQAVQCLNTTHLEVDTLLPSQQRLSCNKMAQTPRLSHTSGVVVLRSVAGLPQSLRGANLWPPDAEHQDDAFASWHQGTALQYLTDQPEQ